MVLPNRSETKTKMDSAWTFCDRVLQQRRKIPGVQLRPGVHWLGEGFLANAVQAPAYKSVSHDGNDAATNKDRGW